MAASPAEVFFASPPSIRTVVRTAGPRLVRDGFGPLAAFFAGWKLIGLTAGIAAAVVFGLAVYVHERRRGRPAMIVRVALVLVAIRASVGLTSGSATAYLAQEIAIDTVLGTIVLGSLATARPFASWFSEEIQPVPDEVACSPSYRRAMRTITLVWGVYFLARASVRLLALLTLSTDQYVLVAGVSDAPFLLAILAWSVYHTDRTLRRSEEWGQLIEPPLIPDG